MYSYDRPRSAPSCRQTLGGVCLALGLIGLVLPLLPGIPLLIIGALLLRHTERATTAPAMNRNRARLSGLEKLELRFWLFARRITMGAESIRLARRDRQRGY